MPRFEVVPHRRWKHSKTGAIASVHGSLPYANAADAAFWKVEDFGYTIHDTVTNTYGAYACPVGSSKEHAESVAERLNSIMKAI